MKHQWLGVLLAIALLISPLAATAQAAEGATLQGLITQVQDGYFIMADETAGEVRVNLDDALTRYEGVAAKDTLAVGQYVYVQYSGIMTRSLPPQVTAQKVSCFVVTGTVSDILVNGYRVTGDEVLGDVIVHMGENMPNVYLGVPVSVYYSGVMALSMPPQISAVHVVVPMLSGTVSAVTAEGFTLTDEAGVAYGITLNAETRVHAQPAEGDAVNVYYNGQLADGTGAIALEVVAQNAQTVME